jgi:hypothetical protein
MFGWLKDEWCFFFHSRIPVVQRAEFDGNGGFSSYTKYVCPICEPEELRGACFTMTEGGVYTTRGKIDPGGLEYMQKIEKEYKDAVHRDHVKRGIVSDE